MREDIARLQEENDALRNQLQFRSRMTNMIVHDQRTPANAIELLAKCLIDDIDRTVKDTKLFSQGRCNSNVRQSSASQIEEKKATPAPYAVLPAEEEKEDDFEANPIAP